MQFNNTCNDIMQLINNINNLHNNIVRELKVYNDMKNSVDVLENELSNNDTVDMLNQLNIIVNNKSVELNKKHTTYNDYIAELKTHKTNIEENIKLLCDINNNITDCMKPLCDNEKYHINDETVIMRMSDNNPIYYELSKYSDLYNKDNGDDDVLEPVDVDINNNIDDNNNIITHDLVSESHDVQSSVDLYGNIMLNFSKEFTSCAFIFMINIFKLLHLLFNSIYEKKNLY